jgi:hypothetical protein
VIALRPLLTHWLEPRPGRVTARITCATCGWRAELTDDTPVEVMQALARLLRGHQLEFHPGESPS